MKYLKALGIKFIIVSVAMLMILGVFNFTFSTILIMSLTLTGISFIVGDLLILPRFGNIVASIADLGLAFGGIWFLTSLFVDAPYYVIRAAFYTSLFITAGEVMFHAYLQHAIINEQEEANRFQGNPQYQLRTEFAEENDVTNLEKSVPKERENE